jgi:heme A synthase
VLATLSTDEILNNFDKSAEHASSVHENRAIGTLVTAIVLYLGGLAALLYASPILAAVLFLSGLHFNLHSHRHLTMAEIATQNRQIAHLIASLGAKSHVTHGDAG